MKLFLEERKLFPSSVRMELGMLVGRGDATLKKG